MGFDNFRLFLTLDIGFIVLSLDLRIRRGGAVFPFFFTSLWIAALSLLYIFFSSLVIRTC